MSNLHSSFVFRVLLVEDDPAMQRAILSSLPPEVLVIPAGTAREARALLSSETFNLTLLDLSLPDEDGLRLCSWIRDDERHRDMPLVLLTGRDGLEDKVMAFSLGADEYLVKPVEPREFKARILAKLEKQRRSRESEQIFCIGNLRFVVPLQQLFIANKKVEITPLELRLLLLLAKHEGRVFSRNEVISSAWGHDVHVLDRTVDSHLSDLRKKLGAATHMIKAVRGEGYQFVEKTNNRKKAAS